jgi:replicative DNA helicase
VQDDLQPLGSISHSASKRVPPHNLEAERSVLGAIFVQNDAIDNVRETGLEAPHFYVDAHQKIYEICCLLSDRRQPVDLITVTSALKDRNWFDEVGGTQSLARLFDDTFAVGNAQYYAKIVREKAIIRRMIDTCSEIISDAVGGIEDAELFLDQTEAKIFAVSDIKNERAMVDVKTVLFQNMKSIEDLALKNSDVTGLATGFHDLDRLTTGFHPGQVFVLASRPGMGKTSWFLSSVLHSAVKDGAVAAIFSLEMSREEIGFRLLSGQARIDSKKLKTGRLSDRDWAKMAEAADKIAKARIFIDDSGGMTILDIRSRCRRLKAMQGKLDLIVVDYLQLMRGTAKSGGRSDGREREIAEISRGLKELAKELKVPIIACSQLNRSVESRQDKRPQLSDLRESGAIEQDADMVAFIHRDDYYDRESENKGLAEIIIAKNRSGEQATVKLAWLGQYTLFANLSHDAAGAPVGGPRIEKGDVVL